MGIFDWIMSFFNRTKGDTLVSKEQIVIDAKAALAAGQDQLMTEVMGQVYDLAQSEVVTGPGGPTEEEIQARIDLAVSEALAADAVLDQVQIDELTGMIAGLQGQMAELQAQYDALVIKEGESSAAVEKLKTAKDQLQSVVDYLSGLFAPPPPPPVEEPPVEEPPVQE